VSRPTLTIIAGANGAGKSTLTAGSPGTFGAIPLLDPDAFANTLRSNETGISTIAAGKEVLRLAKEHLKRRESFAVETTLSGELATRLLDVYTLGASDSLQLAAALTWCQQRPAQRRFISGDQRLCDAAEAAGFVVIALVRPGP